MEYNFSVSLLEKIGMKRQSVILIGGCFAALLLCVTVCSVLGKIVGGIVGSLFGSHEAGEGIGEGIGVFVGAGICLPICLGVIHRLDRVFPHEIAPNPYADGTHPEHGLDTIVLNHNKSCRISTLEECAYRG